MAVAMIAAMITTIMPKRSTGIFSFFVICLFSLPSPASQEVFLPRSDSAETPVRLYGDWSKGCPSTLVLSHGLGGNNKGLAYLAEAMASDGFRVAVMEHRESSKRLLFKTLLQKNNVADALLDKTPHQARMMDLDAAYAFATRDCKPSVLVLGGHSFGAATTLTEAGAINTLGIKGKNRFDAYIALSPQGQGQLFKTGAWAAITKPVLVVTGTRDTVSGQHDYRPRLDPYFGMPPGQKMLAVIDDAEHMDLGGRGKPEMASIVVEIVRHFIQRTQNPANKARVNIKGVHIQTK
jgi:predicted dienelactone hydrolase